MKKYNQLNSPRWPVLLIFLLASLTMTWSGCGRILDYREKYEGDFRFHVQLDSISNGNHFLKSETDFDGHVYVCHRDSMVTIHFLEDVILDVYIDKKEKLWLDPQVFIPTQAAGKFDGRSKLEMEVFAYLAYHQVYDPWYKVTGERIKDK